ncbi:MAG: allantoate amidohydrolase [Ktedonobacterales bacterium]
MDDDALDRARGVLARCDALGAISEEADVLTRRYGTPAMRQVNELVADWMCAAGMTVERDAIGNLRGRYEADGAGARTLLLGSHLDTVRDAGKYDGPLGVLIALAAVERLHARGERLPYAIELYGFADEEGLRYHTGYLGSRVTAGAFDPAALDATGDDGVPLAQAIRDFGGDPAALAAAARRADALLGYVEVHIEQGPVLEHRGLPVGIVSAIQAQSRASITFSGEAGHAGTVPMALRHDALAAAAEFITGVERLARETPDLVATVGQLSVAPGASNVIPGRVALSLDLRHPENDTLRQASARARALADELAARRGVRVEWAAGFGASVACSPRLMRLLARAVTEAGVEPLILPSGAGHDGAMLARLTEIAMLFVRCKGGISHNPAESVTEADVAVALDTLSRLLALLAADPSPQ